MEQAVWLRTIHHHSSVQGGDIEEGLPITMEQAVWFRNIKKNIAQRAEGVRQSIPPYFWKLYALENDNHPSIFRMHGRRNAITVAVIGPYHRSSSSQAIITDDKKSAIVMFLIRWYNLQVDQFLQWALQNEERARLCYEKDSLTIISAMECAKMLLLDGCLILLAIFHLRSSVREDKRPSRLVQIDTNSQDAIIRKKDFIRVSGDIAVHMEQLRLDMLMLDNQIPFFAVEKLYEGLEGSLFEGIRHGIKEMALSCFDDIHPRPGHARATNTVPGTVHHLLHLFHWSRIPSSKYNVKMSSYLLNEPNAHLPSATELRESATLFWKSPSGSPLDVSFHRSMHRMGAAVISIPAVHITDYSESIFRNLIAFEQSHIRCSLSVTAYSICMARLLQSKADAKILRKNKILAHSKKTNREIVDFFRGLSDEYQNTWLPKDLKKLYDDVSRHHDSCLDRTCGGIVLQYCPNKWITVSVICGAIILVATLANNIHSVYRYYHPLRE